MGEPAGRIELQGVLFTGQLLGHRATTGKARQGALEGLGTIYEIGNPRAPARQERARRGSARGALSFSGNPRAPAPSYGPRDLHPHHEVGGLGCSCYIRAAVAIVVQAEGIEPSIPAWRTDVSPQHFAC